MSEQVSSGERERGRKAGGGGKEEQRMQLKTKPHTQCGEQKSVSKLFHAQIGFEVVPIRFLEFRFFLPTSQGSLSVHQNAALNDEQSFGEQTCGRSFRAAFPLMV